MRPCLNEHSLSPAACRLCHWCADRSPLGRSYRRLWGEPEPHGQPDWPRYFDEHNLCAGTPGKRFNASLIDYEGAYLLAFRNGWSGSDVYLVRLDLDFRPVSEPVRLELFHPREANYGREDPRLFWFNGALHVAYVGVVGGHSIRHTSMLYARLGRDLRVERVFYPHYPGRNFWEKNWGFFEHDGRLYATYSIAPHRVLHVDGEQAVMAYQTQTPAPWSGGEMRPGSAPTLIGDERWCFFHDRVERGGRLIYRMGVYVFDAQPPFRIRRVTREPILSAEVATTPADQYASVVFPCGAVRRENDWVVSLGVHDRWTELHAFDAAELESRMVRIAPPTWFALREDVPDDRIIWSSVAGQDEYGARAMELTSADTVLDVGAHIGSFTWLAFELGAGRVVSVEPFPPSNELLRRNVQRYGQRSRVFDCAVWHCEGVVDLALPYADEHTGAWRVVHGGGACKVPCKPLDAIIEEAIGDAPIRLLKIDCEGGEYPGLLTCRRLGQIREIVGEYHDVPCVLEAVRVPGQGRPRIAVLARHLEAAGFRVTVRPIADGLGHFHARRV
jgi:FkbM family methyltransferase